jgi:hypothetical protein
MTNELYVTKSGMKIDPSYFKDSGEQFLFKPFNVKQTQSLAKAVETGKVPLTTELLVVALPHQAPLALIKRQMAYHHVAQGVFNGEAWLASY